MLQSAARSILRSAARPAPSVSYVTRPFGKRFASTSPVNARRSWKGSAARWGVAIAGIYYYNTSPVFAEQPQHNLLNPNLDALDDERRDHSALEALTSSRARQAERNASVLHSAADSLSSENASTTVIAENENPLNTGAAELEDEAAGQGAFNPETGEINWDCSCLGGMAYGPCGPEFREAFSCFVYSAEEPKGMDCIDKFQNMQQCFQRHPEVYKGELEDDEELSAGLEEERQELVNEIAERKRQQSESGSQRRLLEEPDPAPKMTPASKSAATEVPPYEPQDHSIDATSSNEQSSKPPSRDPSHQSALSPESETVAQDKSAAASERTRNSLGEETKVPQPEIVPREAFNATPNAGER